MSPRTRAYVPSLARTWTRVTLTVYALAYLAAVVLTGSLTPWVAEPTAAPRWAATAIEVTTRTVYAPGALVPLPDVTAPAGISPEAACAAVLDQTQDWRAQMLPAGWSVTCVPDAQWPAEYPGAAGLATQAPVRSIQLRAVKGQDVTALRATLAHEVGHAWQTTLTEQGRARVVERTSDAPSWDHRDPRGPGYEPQETWADSYARAVLGDEDPSLPYVWHCAFTPHEVQDLLDGRDVARIVPTGNGTATFAQPGE